MGFRNVARAVLLMMGVGSFAVGAKAQIGIYGAPTFARVSNSTPDPGVYAFLGANSTSRVFSGIEVGAYDQLVHSGSLDAGVDLRATIQKGANAHLNEFLIGGRVQYHASGSRLKPYAELLGGVGGSRAATNPIYKSKATYGGFAGLDYQLGKYVDLRAIEVGYSSLSTVSTAAVTAAAIQPGSSSLIHISAGIVFRLPQRNAP